MNFELTKSVAKHLAFLKEIPFLPIIVDEQIKVMTLFFQPKVFAQMIGFVRAVKKLPEVSSHYHRYGGLEFRVHGKEFCHMHGDGLVDLILNREICRKLLLQQRVEPHHVHPDTNWISYPIRKDTDVADLLEIAQRAYALRLDRGFPKVSHEH